MKKITLLPILVLAISLLFSSCVKDKGFEINTKILSFKVDSMSIAGPIEKSANLDYNLNTIASEFDVKAGK